MSDRHTFAALLMEAAHLIETWIERASQRRALRALPDHVMRDMALSRADVEAEAGKPFWQA